MKHQYFGDVNDYRKYGLLRALQAGNAGELLVAWMLTPDDGTNDGGKTGYLGDSVRWAGLDPELFSALSRFVRGERKRDLSLLESSPLLPRTRFFSEFVPDAREPRREWASMLRAKAEGCTLVFLDPDNGLEVKSKPVGRKGSSKYVAWSEIEAVWKGEASILIYQHFPRRERAPFIESRLEELRERLKAPVALAFATAHVAFFLVAQPKHSHWFREAADRVASMWRDQIRIVRST